MATRQDRAAVVHIEAVKQDHVMVAIVGTSPLIFNRMAEKARQQLLLGGSKKTSAEKAGTVKHNPIEEFRASPYRMRDPQAPTLLGFPSSAFKASMETAALETPGAKKTQIGRLVTVPWDNVPIFGVPEIFCSVTRSADIAKTPDVRTRAIVPHWACTVTIGFVMPTLNAKMVMTLLANAGIVSGIGDYRQEKGAGAFGCFRITSPDDQEFQTIMAGGGRAMQAEALENPQPFDDETRELLMWYSTETARRGFKVA